MSGALRSILFLYAAIAIAACGPSGEHRRGNAHEGMHRMHEGGFGEQQGAAGLAQHAAMRGMRGFRRVCADDIQKYCADDAMPREQRRCLRENLDKLDETCKAALARHRRRNEASPE